MGRTVATPSLALPPEGRGDCVARGRWIGLPTSKIEEFA